MIFLSLFLFIFSLYLMMIQVEIILEFNLQDLSSISLVSMFYIDWKSLLFMSFVLYISSLIMNYSSEYMSVDLNLKRFIYLVLLFVFSMMMMILSMNLVSILLGWDGLGLVSYVLVIYYQNVKSYNAGMLTALSNRVGDAALLMSIAWMISCGSWNILNYLEMETKFMYMISVFCILAAFTKSAQIPFSSWLPAAMAAPTPVSALVHSSTLVTAGVYLLIRVSGSFSEGFMHILLVLSLFTMFMAGVCANFEYDLKKIIALSTLSQLGMMITILSLGGQDLAFFHLLTHALFKALLFMCAGVIIHTFMDSQDIRMMGGLISFMPVTCVCMNISNFALCGIPFLSGFYSKDLMAEFLSMKIMSGFIYWIFYISIGLTVSYSFRLSYFIFWGDFNFNSYSNMSCLNNKVMMKSMLGLIFLVIFMGSILMWMMLVTPYFIILPGLMKMMTLLFIFMGIILGIELNNSVYFYKLLSCNYLQLSMFLSGMWNLPILSTLGVYPSFLFYGKQSIVLADMGWYEYYGSSGLIKVMTVMMKNLQLLSMNHLKLFMFIFMIYLMIFIII
uniref:NADH-ubiquinone oxidoreductase chain 5 n=1 Tax=Scolytinae sp. BMNH 1043133 TaxID=1903798 RepID=A0A343A4U4_9CUCU|nr:NADH dehydrogenase subunit 5 [Scolytinae sp. BMNH 1043133]